MNAVVCHMGCPLTCLHTSCTCCSRPAAKAARVGVASGRLDRAAERCAVTEVASVPSMRCTKRCTLQDIYGRSAEPVPGQ